jgi:hypothetical protein
MMALWPLMGKKSALEIVSWLDEFQSEVNNWDTDYNGLQLTVCLWDHNEKGFVHKWVSIGEEDLLPFLDMTLFWNEKKELRRRTFTVFHKPGQQIKYLNQDSTHPPHVFHVITKSGVLKRLSSLMTASSENQGHPITLIHPTHFNALHHANLWAVNANDLTLSELQQSNKIVEEKSAKKMKDKDNNINVYLCLGYSMFWKKPLHMTITCLKREHHLPCWLRFAMSYHRFPKLSDIFQSHLSVKMIEDI